MGERPLGQLRGAIHGYLLPHRHTSLLVAVVIAFAVRPLIGDLGIGPIIFSIAVIILMLVSLLISLHRNGPV